jgi:putative sugar O-methyltransferase
MSSGAAKGHRESLLRFAPDRFDVRGDPGTLTRIEADACDNGGHLAPSAQWQLPEEAKVSLLALLDALLGPVGKRQVDADAVACYRSMLREIDHLGLCEPNLLLQASKLRWTKSDLGTVMDLNLTTSCLGSLERLAVCEVGGGYGRVAEGFLRLWPANIHYVLVDAVPATLMYAYEYLRATFPNRRIGSYYAGDAYSPEFDCYILPAWRTDELPDGAFDLAVNIESMQEMDGRQVSHFLGLFDRVTRPSACIYISNARDYVYKGDWHFPATWEVLYQHNTPRSWSRNHPTIVMRKGEDDYSTERAACERAFELEMAEWNPGLSTLTPAGR